VALEPKDLNMWHNIVTQARAKFRVYPSPAAAHWVHKTYKDRGGQFVDTAKSRSR
jgi:hypothetical protein